MMETNQTVKLHQPLTPRELQVAEWLAEGKSNKQIAAVLGIGVGTVKTHVEHIIEKLGVNDRVQAAVWFARTAPYVPEMPGRTVTPYRERSFEQVLWEVEALVRQGEDSPMRILNRLRSRGYLGGIEPIKDLLYPGWR